MKFRPLEEVQAQAFGKITNAPRPTDEEAAKTRATIAKSNRPGGSIGGNNKDRLNRKVRLLKEFGDGNTAQCVHCGIGVGLHSMTQDRIVPGSQGGRYVHANLLPSCMSCNRDRELAGTDLADYMTNRPSRVGKML